MINIPIKAHPTATRLVSDIMCMSETANRAALRLIAIYETVGISRIHDRNLFTKNEDVQREPGSSAYHVSMLQKYLRMVAANAMTSDENMWKEVAESNESVVPGSSGELRCRRFPIELREREGSDMVHQSL
jgi:hypothetical protein